MRLWTFILGGGTASKVKHFTGLPPELTRGNDTRQKMEDGCFLVIEEKSDGVFLYRYGSEGKFLGDTWHLNIDVAKNEVAHEFGNRIATWVDVPAEVQDVVAFGVNRLGSAQ